MKLITLLCSLILATTGMSARADDLTSADQTASDDCEDEANQDDDECLLLPPIEEATNFVFAIAPLLGSAAAIGLVAAVAGSGGGGLGGGGGIGVGTSTPSSTQ